MVSERTLRADASRKTAITVSNGWTADNLPLASSGVSPVFGAIRFTMNQSDSRFPNSSDKTARELASVRTTMRKSRESDGGTGVGDRRGYRRRLRRRCRSWRGSGLGIYGSVVVARQVANISHHFDLRLRVGGHGRDGEKHVVPRGQRTLRLSAEFRHPPRSPNSGRWMSPDPR